MIDPLFEAAPTFDDPLGMLRACHRRIERALDVLERVSELEARGPLDASAREALRRTLSYFAIGVPRHAQDEEESLFPRLAASGGVIAHLEHDHAELDRMHQEVDALGQELLAAGRFADPASRERSQALASSLREVYTQHIRVEDEELFPLAARLVGAPELEAMGAEMAARRGIEWDRHREVLAQFSSRSWAQR